MDDRQRNPKIRRRFNTKNRKAIVEVSCRPDNPCSSELIDHPGTKMPRFDGISKFFCGNMYEISKFSLFKHHGGFVYYDDKHQKSPSGAYARPRWRSSPPSCCPWPTVIEVTIFYGKKVIEVTKI